jgi:Zn-dependent peptidase ImmA (M78 family)/DNA-binding XRE family transcriptional regulator
MDELLNQFAGEQLRIVRMAFGYSLEELGQLVGATRQYIHQLEIGAKSPSKEMREALADVLGVTTSFFDPRPLSSVRPEQCHFRKQRTTPASVTSQALARGTLLDLFTAEIDQTLRLPEVNFPDLPLDDGADIDGIANECRRHWRLGTGPILNMVRVVENAGAIVTYFDGLSERVDAFSMDRKRPVIVRSSAKESLCRQRFDLAHECGHLVMHKGVQTGDKITESQANRFASAFLLPRGAFIAEFPRGSRIDWNALYELKLRWKVSVSAIVRRAFDLELLTAAQYRIACIHLTKTGQTKAERFDEELPLEQPELISTAIDFLAKDGWERLRQVVNRAGLAEHTFLLLTGKTLPDALAQPHGENVISFSGWRK